MLYRIIIGIFTGLGLIGYIWHSNNVIDQLKQDVSVYEESNAKYQETLAALQQMNVENQARLGQLSDKLQVAEKTNDDLRIKLRKHNLELLALKKPVLIEKRINDASKNIINAIINDTNF